MRALFVYSRFTGNSFFIKRIKFIEERLKTKFNELDMVETHNLEELKNECIKACRSYDYLLFVGGDGTINTIINIIAEEKRKPILGLIPGGTVNDFAKNFRLSKNLSKAVDNLINGEPAPFDIVKANDKYFCYVLCCGAFSEISYTAKRGLKKKIGPLAYYFLAVRDVFIPRKIEGTLTIDGTSYDIKTPFLLILNSNHVGGFYLSLSNRMNDGKFSVFITKPGAFNGLLHYLLFKIRTKKIKTNEFTFKFKKEIAPWCVDGEMAKLGNIHVKCLPSHLNLIVPKTVATKLKLQKIGRALEYRN